MRGRTWGEIVKVLRRSEQYLRDCYILIRPEATDAPIDLAQQVEAGILTKGQAVQIARGQTKLGDGGERLFKAVRKALAVKDIEALIDATPRDGEANLARLTAFAEVLGRGCRGGRAGLGRTHPGPCRQDTQGRRQGRGDPA